MGKGSTCKIAVLAINAHPVEARAGDEARQIRPRKHLPCAEAGPRPGREGLLQPVCRFHDRSHGRGERVSDMTRSPQGPGALLV